MKHRNHTYPTTDIAASGMQRRTLLRSAVTLGAGLALPSNLIGCAGHYYHHAGKPLLDVTLTATRDAADDRLYFYNGKTPGPTLRVRRGRKGGQLRIKLVNDMPPNANGDADNCPPDHNVEHGLNTTNLHTHGLHVSPTKDRTGHHDADNVFLQVIPDDDPPPSCGSVGDDIFRRHYTQYVFDIPADHPPGTHWYHAHKHGSTDKQVRGGLAGALIIEEEEWDDVPSYIANAEEQVFMFQQPPGVPLSIVLVDEAGGGTEPNIVLRPGEVRRWRFINGSPSMDAFVRFTGDPEGVELYQIAFDGLTLPKRIPVDLTDNRPASENPFSLAPGNRTDMLVRAPLDAAGKRFALNMAPYDGGEMLGARILRAAQEGIQISVEGEPQESEWSDDDSLPGPGLEEIADDEIVDTKDVRFNFVENTFLLAIDGERFTGQVPDDRVMELGTAEEWTVHEETEFTHPFHIHVNPFFVTHINGVELPSDDPRRRWQDTIALPPGNAVKFRTRFADFAGKFVIHCHILGHEDAGMMQAVRVDPPASA